MIGVRNFCFIHCLLDREQFNIEYTERKHNDTDEDYDMYDDEGVVLDVGEAVCHFFTPYNIFDDRARDLVDMADARSQEMYDVISAITNKDGDLDEDYIELGILYIENFYIKPEFKGKGIGLTVFPMLLDILSRGVGATAIVPYPSQEEIESNKSMLKKKEKFLKQFGFSQVDEKNMVWVKNMTYKNNVIIKF